MRVQAWRLSAFLFVRLNGFKTYRCISSDMNAQLHSGLQGDGQMKEVVFKRMAVSIELIKGASLADSGLLH